MANILDIQQQAEDAYADLMLAYFRMRKAGHAQIEYESRQAMIGIFLQDQNDMRKRAKELGITF